MEVKDIKELIKAVDSSSITEFEFQKDDIKIVLKKGNSSIHKKDIESIKEEMAPVKHEEQIEINNKDTKEDLHIIKSPIVGTFYSSPNPNSEAYVKPGSRVKKGDVLCIVEAMKLMNEITSDADGEIVEVFVENQSFVEYGQPLFSIRTV